MLIKSVIVSIPTKRNKKKRLWFVICKHIGWVLKKKKHIIELGLVYLFNGISTPYGLFNAKIWSIYTPSYVIKYSYQIQIIYTQLYVFKCSYQILIINTQLYGSK